MKSSTVRIPPPTVNGMKTQSATALTTSTIIFLASLEAVISSRTSSSAPSLSYILAHSTGSPASRRFTKLVPFRTQPSFMSRHGIILFAYIFTPPLQCQQNSLISAVRHDRFFRDETVLQIYFYIERIHLYLCHRWFLLQRYFHCRL